MRTDFRLGRLPAEERPALADLGDPDTRRAFYALCVYAWACLPRDHAGLATPEDVAELLKTEEQQAEALRALHAAALEAGIIKKKAPDPTPPTSTSPGGPSACSSSGVPGPTTGN